MYRQTRFYQGEILTGFTLDGKEIIGQYKGLRASFGALIFGNTVGSTDPQALHTVRTLSLTRPKVKAQRSPNRTDFVAPTVGDPCTGLTKDKKKVVGFYMNSDGAYVWLKGWKEGTSRLEPTQAIKVIKTSLKKTA